MLPTSLRHGSSQSLTNTPSLIINCDLHKLRPISAGVMGPKMYELTRMIRTSLPHVPLTEGVLVATPHQVRSHQRSPGDKAALRISDYLQAASGLEAIAYAPRACDLDHHCLRVKPDGTSAIPRSQIRATCVYEATPCPFAKKAEGTG